MKKLKSSTGKVDFACKKWIPLLSFAIFEVSQPVFGTSLFRRIDRAMLQRSCSRQHSTPRTSSDKEEQAISLAVLDGVLRSLSGTVENSCGHYGSRELIGTRPTTLLITTETKKEKSLQLICGNERRKHPRRHDTPKNDREEEEMKTYHRRRSRCSDAEEKTN